MNPDPLNRDKKIPISPLVGGELIEKAHSDIIHNICRGILIRSLKSMNVRVESLSGGKREREDDEEESKSEETSESKTTEEFINRYWNGVIEDVIFYGTTLGFFVYTITEVETPLKGKKSVFIKKPFILPQDSYSVDICITPEYVCYYGVTGEKSEKDLSKVGYDSNLKYFGIPGYEPSKEGGRYKSIVASSLQGSKWIDQLYDSFVKANIQRSHPPIVLQESSTGKAAESNLVNLEKLGTGLAGLQNDKAREEAAQKQESLNGSREYTMSLGNQGQAVASSKGDGNQVSSVFRPTTVDAIFPLPSGYEMATPQPPMPEPQPDLLNYDATRMRQVCALYGIPSSSIVSEARSKSGTSTTATDDNDNLALQRTLHFWQRVIRGFLTEVYLTIRQDLKGESDVQITIPIIPYTSTTKIHEFVDRNIIATKKGKEYVAAIAGLSAEDILDGENEHLVPPMHGNENQTTALIKAKEKVMNAEAAERMAKAKAVLQGEQDMSKGEMELKDKEMELEEMEFENKMKLMDKQMEVEKVKTDAAMKKASAQVKVNKSAPKKTGP